MNTTDLIALILVTTGLLIAIAYPIYLDNSGACFHGETWNNPTDEDFRCYEEEQRRAGIIVIASLLLSILFGICYALNQRGEQS